MKVTTEVTAEVAAEVAAGAEPWRLPGRSRLPEPVWRVRHRWVTTVLLVHLPVLLGWAVAHHASTDTLLTLCAPAALYLAAAMETLSRGRLPLPPVLASCAAAAGLMACSSFLVAVSGGYIEAHFHFFVMIPVVALYEDWAPFAVAAAIVLLEHGVVGTLWPHKVYGHAALHGEHPWLFAAIHAGFVVAACLGSLTAWTLSERARTAQQRLLRQLHHRTRHDDLTGLANRTGLSEALDAALTAAQATGTPVSVLVMDLDHFKTVNDTLGHSAGDDLLREVAARATASLTETLTGALTESLSGTTSPDALTVRLGGDEFAVLLPGLDAGRALQLAQHLRRGIGRATTLLGTTVSTSVSIGVASRCVPPAPHQPGTDQPAVSAADERAAMAEQLLREADVAMYVAKTSGSGTSLYDPTHDQHTTERLAALNDFQQALDSDAALAQQPGGRPGGGPGPRPGQEDDRQIVVHLQPKVSVSTGRLLGVEALARWNHPTRGVLPPSEFIAMATSPDLSEAFTTRVLEAALAQCGTWLRAGYEVPVSINVTAHCLPRLALPMRLLDALGRHGVPPRLLCLELTEDILVADPETTAQVLTSLRHTGIRCSVDDFGTGFSSLSYLRRLPLDELKIDRSFVLGMFPHGPDGAVDDVVVGAVIDLGHRLGVHVVAEGVEHQRELDVLTRLGCDSVQGYLHSPPVPAAAFPQHLLETSRTTRPHRLPV
ncbi:putative bifunctional diguanylate cyclase/phosphodiesterase [Kineococcus sp. TBRC 1896]|uniref:Bifunctional diguanylate cyclase/phosphodiesterase n=1 Tax=Kineococcus mangrovi TaxID=1660183 RepID=A0ABV4I260_9ACTN